MKSGDKVQVLPHVSSSGTWRGAEGIVREPVDLGPEAGPAWNVYFDTWRGTQVMLETSLEPVP